MLATAPRTTLTPFVVAPDCAAFLDFATAAFDATELDRETDGAGRVTGAELEVGESLLLVLGPGPGRPARPAYLGLLVEDAGAVRARALAAGAHCERDGRVVDPAGNVWSLVE